MKDTFPTLNLELLINTCGIDSVIEPILTAVLEYLTTRDIAYQFVLEEIKAASYGNELAKKFVNESGIYPSEYTNFINDSISEVDKAQQILIGFCIGLMHNQELMVKLRVGVVDQVMRSFFFGKYSKKFIQISHMYKIFLISNKLPESILSDAEVFKLFSELNGRIKCHDSVDSREKMKLISRFIALEEFFPDRYEREFIIRREYSLVLELGIDEYMKRPFPATFIGHPANQGTQIISSLNSGFVCENCSSENIKWSEYTRHNGFFLIEKNGEVLSTKKFSSTECFHCKMIFYYDEHCFGFRDKKLDAPPFNLDFTLD